MHICKTLRFRWWFSLFWENGREKPSFLKCYDWWFAKNGDYKLCFETFRELITCGSKPDNWGPGALHIAFKYLCANDGKWKDVAKIRDLMTKRRIQKIPGYTWIEVDNIIHQLMMLKSWSQKIGLMGHDASRFHHFKEGTCSCGDYW